MGKLVEYRKPSDALQAIPPGTSFTVAEKQIGPDGRPGRGHPLPLQTEDGSDVWSHEQFQQALLDRKISDGKQYVLVPVGPGIKKGGQRITLNLEMAQGEQAEDPGAQRESTEMGALGAQYVQAHMGSALLNTNDNLWTRIGVLERKLSKKSKKLAARDTEIADLKMQLAAKDHQIASDAINDDLGKTINRTISTMANNPATPGMLMTLMLSGVDGVKAAMAAQMAAGQVAQNGVPKVG